MAHLHFVEDETEHQNSGTVVRSPEHGDTL
jgi:hypothetical protein